jgi:hypothetical protein
VDSLNQQNNEKDCSTLKEQSTSDFKMFSFYDDSQDVQKLKDQAMQCWSARCAETRNLCHYINFKHFLSVLGLKNILKFKDFDKFRK